MRQKWCLFWWFLCVWVSGWIGRGVIMNTSGAENPLRRPSHSLQLLFQGQTWNLYVGQFHFDIWSRPCSKVHYISFSTAAVAFAQDAIFCNVSSSAYLRLRASLLIPLWSAHSRTDNARPGPGVHCPYKAWPVCSLIVFILVCCIFVFVNVIICICICEFGSYL